MRERFALVAVDQHVHRKLQDEEGKLFAKVLRQAGRGLGGQSQGVYLFTPEGELLAFSNTANDASVRRLMSRAIDKFHPESAPLELKLAKLTHDFCQPPEGGLVLDVTTKVLGGYENASGRRSELHANSLGRDHLWLRKDEAQSLARGELPESVARRLVRYHLVDNTRGEPPFWHDGEIKKLNVKLVGGRIEGSVHLETKSGARGYRAALLGFVETKQDKVTRVDLLVKGEFWGEGRYTRGAPPGKFPLAVAFRLAEVSCQGDKVLPGGARGNLSGYLK